jgi:hypothetical protein
MMKTKLLATPLTRCPTNPEMTLAGSMKMWMSPAGSTEYARGPPDTGVDVPPATMAPLISTVPVEVHTDVGVNVNLPRNCRAGVESIDAPTR